MKRMRYISGRVQTEILDDYREKLDNGNYRWTLAQIAEKHEVSLSTVNNLVRLKKCKCRPHGGPKLTVPDARTMKILRDATIPGIKLDEVGVMNPRIVGGVEKPLTKQRISQLVIFWSKRYDKIRSRAFKPGDILRWKGGSESWSERRYKVLRFDDHWQGAVVDLNDGRTIDPFQWTQGNARVVRDIAK